MIDFLTEANLNFGTNFTKKELLAYCYSHQDRLKKQWIASGRKDYSVYDDVGYAWDCILSFYCVSSRCLTNGERYFRAKGIQKGKALDVFNGNGLSTVYANQLGFDCDAFSTSAPQIEFAQKTANRLLGKNLNIFNDLKKLEPESYDVLFSFEVLEHFDNPLEHIEDLMRLLKPGGHLVESTGFKECDHCGHFEYHNINGNLIHHRKVPQLVRSRLEKQCTKVMVGFDKKPRIWVKTIQDKPKVMFRGVHQEMLDLGLLPHFK